MGFERRSLLVDCRGLIGSQIRHKALAVKEYRKSHTANTHATQGPYDKISGFAAGFAFSLTGAACIARHSNSVFQWPGADGWAGVCEGRSPRAAGDAIPGLVWRGGVREALWQPVRRGAATAHQQTPGQVRSLAFYKYTVIPHPSTLCPSGASCFQNLKQCEPRDQGCGLAWLSRPVLF